MESNTAQFRTSACQGRRTLTLYIDSSKTQIIEVVTKYIEDKDKYKARKKYIFTYHMARNWDKFHNDISLINI